MLFARSIIKFKSEEYTGKPNHNIREFFVPIPCCLFSTIHQLTVTVN